MLKQYNRMNRQANSPIMKKIYTTYLFHLLIIVEIIVLILLLFRPHDNTAYKNETCYALNNDWTYVDRDGISRLINLPARLDAAHDNTVTIKRTLPNDIPDLQSLCILSEHQDIYAYIGNKLIFSHSHNFSKFLNVPPASMWIVIELPPSSADKTITLKIKSQYSDYAGKVSAVFAGTKSSMLIHFIKNSGLKLLITLITLINGCISIIVYYFMKRLLKLNRSIFYLGWFFILASLWMITENNLIQLSFSNEYILSALAYLTLMTFPIPLLLYNTLLDNYHYKRTACCLSYIFTGSTFLLIILQFFNFLDFYKSLCIVKSEIILLFGVIIITLLSELLYYKNRDIRAFTISSGILFICGIIEVFHYNYGNGMNNGIYFQFGFLIFTIVLIMDSLKRFARAIKLSKTAGHYKFLATRDLLTNCRNRVAYTNDLEHIPPNRNVTVFMADMNNMKAINDNYGHQAGDEAIISVSQCLLKVFGQRVYRIGGDEFVCIVYDLDQPKIHRMIKDFQSECRIANEDAPNAFYMSIGYATFDKDIDETIFYTVKRADKNMYENKNKMKR